MEIFRVCFFGHREVDNFQYVEAELEKIVEFLLETKEFVEFLVGINGEFDTIAASVIRKVRKRRDEHYNNCLILVLPYDKARSEERVLREMF